MFLTVSQTMELLEVKSRSVFYADIKNQVYPPGVVIRLGTKIRFHKKALEDWLAKGGSLATGQGNNKETQQVQT